MTVSGSEINAPVAVCRSKPSSQFGLGAGLALALAFGTLGPAAASTYQQVYAFTGGSDGSYAQGQLAADKNRMLYGATESDGTGGGGTVFQFNLVSGMLTTLYSFTSFGGTGSAPSAGVVLDAKGMIYGTTQRGGTGTCRGGCGTVFKLDPSTGKLTTLVDFQNVHQGCGPLGLTLVGKQLYGVTYEGGYSLSPDQGGAGTIFKVDLNTKKFTSLHEFEAPGVPDDGASPMAALALAPDGKLYGVALGGGNGAGTVFALDTVTAAFSVVHSFNRNVDGAGPIGKLLARNGRLLGATLFGDGPTGAGYGGVFSINSATGDLTNLDSFAGTDGANPTAGLAPGPYGLVYGVTYYGGTSNTGTLFVLQGNAHKHTVLHNFDTVSGYPGGELLLQSETMFYGLSQTGHGGIYKFVP